MPGNRLALAVEVGGEVDGLGLLRFLHDRPDVLLAALVQLVGHREIVVRIDGTIARRQIADMPIRSQDLEFLAKVPVDGGRFGRRLYDQQFNAVFLGFLFLFINGGSPARCQTSCLPSRRNWPPGPAG